MFLRISNGGGSRPPLRIFGAKGFVFQRPGLAACRLAYKAM
jgi:hypothetical protein